jgi:uncharacterized damage-inducible protein DinB
VRHIARVPASCDHRLMLDHYKQCVLGQFEAALWMLHDCIDKCPPEHWSGPTSIIGTYEFWHVAYHTLYCTDIYLSPTEAAFELRAEFHPGGQRDIDDEYPSRRMEKDELTKYVMHCLTKLRTVFAAETEQSLRGPSGHPRRTFSRGELHLYNMRHVMHHTGQLSALLRRLNLDVKNQPRWGYTGWR